VLHRDLDLVLGSFRRAGPAGVLLTHGVLLSAESETSAPATLVPRR
jgi:hypothetical protein